ncbi:uncharacterized protein F4822DRAFT_273758 [Hypoxylon trugodes]|uniref:uncharacterized protein n=1 Tax=Hypoxylon trugodes TaxID=326681 RepID=UPI00218CCE78|nr:uncharacterized protein F4822DRAFT_273758 [Hypoxylon trugodes]KAI1387106.1 hypothetical protein F4822DRAFT_273758 [Hypoxylon trugodes]
MASNERISISIQPLQYSDISTCARITSAAFSVDPHTIVKQLGGDPFGMYTISSSSFLDTLHKRNYIYVKAVDDQTGAIVGHAGWAFRGLDPELIPWRGPEDLKPTKDTNKQTQGKNLETSEPEKRVDSITRLHALEDIDMQDWISNMVSAEKSCMIVVGLIVAPSYQSRGVGGALMRHGNTMADGLGLPIWVHSSHQAFEAYKKYGFVAARQLDIDLDEYAPRGPEEGEEVMGDKGSGRWGRYIIRYMKRVPKKSNGD